METLTRVGMEVGGVDDARKLHATWPRIVASSW
jgi:hypothetical protein